MLCIAEETKCEHCGGTARLEMAQRNPDENPKTPYIAVYECGCGETTFVNIDKIDDVTLEEEGGKINIGPIGAMEMLEGVLCKLVATRGRGMNPDIAVNGEISYDIGELDENIEEAIKKGSCPIGYIIRRGGVTLNQETHSWYLTEVWRKC